MNRAPLTLILALSSPAWADEAAHRYLLQVDGLACPFCAYGLEKNFRAIDGVKSIDIDLERGLLTLHTRPGTHFTAAQLEALVDDAGYTLRAVTEERP